MTNEEIAALRAENERLRGALEPLVAACVSDFGDDPTDDGAVGAGFDGDMALTFKMIRNARAALAARAAQHDTAAPSGWDDGCNVR